jgi:hypothetical protein
MRNWRPVALVLVPAAAGALGTLLAGAAAGMHTGDLRHILWLIVPALLATLAAIVAIRLALAHLSVRQGLATVSFVGAAVALANLAVLSRQMFVSEHDATVVAVFLLYSAGAGIGAALAVARCPRRPRDCRPATWRRASAASMPGGRSTTWPAPWTTWRHDWLDRRVGNGNLRIDGEISSRPSRTTCARHSPASAP